MRQINVSSYFLVLVTAASLVFCDAARAKPPRTYVDHGFTGALHIASAASGVMDRNYAQYLSINAAASFVSPPLRDAGVTLGQYLQRVASIQPHVVASLGFRYYSPLHQSGYSASDLSLGSYQTGVEASYQHFEGSLQGDGVGLRYSPFNRQSAYGRGIKSAVDQTSEVLRLALEVEQKTPFKVLGKTWSQIVDRIPFDQREADLVKNLKSAVQRLDHQVSSPDGRIDGNPTPLEKAFAATNLATTLAVIGGYSSFNVGHLTDAGVSVSRLIPVSTPTDDHSTAGILALLSAQQQWTASGPGTDTSATRYGVCLAWQNKVATTPRARDRWDTQFGTEYLFKASGDSAASGGAFLRYRPFHARSERPDYGRSIDYFPSEYTLFGGVGHDGYGYIGGRIGFSFSL